MKTEIFKDKLDSDPEFKTLITSIVTIGQKYSFFKDFINSDFEKDNFNIENLSLEQIRVIMAFADPILMNIVNDEVRKLLTFYLGSNK